MNALSSHQPPQRLPVDDLRDAWRLLDTEERVDGFRLLGQAEAQDYFQTLSCHDRADLVLALSMGERRLWMRSLAPDDAADVLQEAPDEARSALLDYMRVAILHDQAGDEVVGEALYHAILAYDKWNGVDKERAKRRLRTRLKLNYASSSWADK